MKDKFLDILKEEINKVKAEIEIVEAQEREWPSDTHTRQTFIANVLLQSNLRIESLERVLKAYKKYSKEK